MAQAKAKKGAKVLEETVSVESVVTAIRARGKDEDGATVCSVRKIKDYILGNTFDLSYCSLLHPTQHLNVFL